MSGNVFVSNTPFLHTAEMQEAQSHAAVFWGGTVLYTTTGSCQTCLVRSKADGFASMTEKYLKLDSDRQQVSLIYQTTFVDLRYFF